MHNRSRKNISSILSRVLLFIAATTACVEVLAASFDCTKAKSGVEKIICGNEELSALDDNLAKVYRELLKDDPDAAMLRNQQRMWLQHRMPECQHQDKVDACLIEKYQRRTGLLKALKALRKTDGSPEDMIGYHLLEEVSKKYDFALWLFGGCGGVVGSEGACDGSGLVGVFHKGKKTPIQIIPMDNIVVIFTESGKPLVNSAVLYDYQGTINVGDFNFDGREDFAIQNGNHGSYSGPSYDVYLADSDGEGFKFNNELSGLIESTLGFFQVDAERKRLITFAKSGCCYHVTTEYQVVDNEPVPVNHLIDELKEGRSFTREERWVDGKWVHVAEEFQRKSTGLVQILPAPKYYENGANGEPFDMVNFPGREYKSGTGWWVLSCSPSCQLTPARLNVISKPFLFEDGLKVDGQHIRWSPEPPEGALLYFRAPAKLLRLVAGPITTAEYGSGGGILPVGSLFTLSMPNGMRVYVIPTLILPKSMANRSSGTLSLELRMNEKRQTLLYGGFRPNDFLSYILWSGDMDGDGKIDLILDSSPSSTCGIRIALFLSSQAKAGEFMGKVGEFDGGKECY